MQKTVHFLNGIQLLFSDRNHKIRRGKVVFK